MAERIARLGFRQVLRDGEADVAGRRTAGGAIVRGIGLLSGGLDSMLAARVLMEQGIDVVPVVFRTPFFGSLRGERAAASLGLAAVVVDITSEHLAMVRSPAHGYGRNMNPCIDCHALMFFSAGAMLDRSGAQFLFSGEVLGQRPMSQNLAALRTVAKASGFEDRILRPLSALLLPETEPERHGLVDRSSLLDIHGRSRRRQMELAQRFGLTEFSSPGGGCLLTDPGFSARLRDLFRLDPSAGPFDIELLKVGRHFRLPSGAKAVVGRNRGENDQIESAARPGDVLLRLADVPGPTTLIVGGGGEGDLEAAAGLTVRYGGAGDGGECRVGVVDAAGTLRTIVSTPMDEGEIEARRVG